MQVIKSKQNSYREHFNFRLSSDGVSKGNNRCSDVKELDNVRGDLGKSQLANCGFCRYKKCMELGMSRGGKYLHNSYSIYSLVESIDVFPSFFTMQKCRTAECYRINVRINGGFKVGT